MKFRILKFWFSLLLLHVFFSASSQSNNQRIDSLLVEVANAKSDSLKCELYIDVVNEYMSTDLIKRDSYLLKAKESLKKSKSKKLHLKIKLLIAYIELFEGKTDKVLAVITSVKSQLKRNYFEDLYLNAIFIESMALNYKGDITGSITLLEQALKKVPRSIYFKDYARVYFSLGQSYGYIYNYPNAIRNIKKALEYYKKAKFYTGVFISYNEICYGYMRIGNYDKALYYSNLCKNYSKTDSNKYVECLTNGQLYYYLERYDASIQYLNEGLKINAKLEDSINTPNFLIFLIKCYIAKKDVQKLFEITNSIRKSEDVVLKFVASYGLANAFYLQQDFDSANDYVNLINTTLIKQVSTWFADDDVINLYKLTSEIKSALGDYKEAYSYQKKYIEQYSKVEQNLKKQNALQLQDEFDSFIKDKRINELTLVKQRNQLKIQRQEYFMILYTIAISFLAVVIFIIFFFLRNIKKKNRIISDNATLIMVQNKEIKQSLAVKELLLKEIHHRVKNNLQIVMNLLRIQSRETNTTLTIKEFVGKSQNRIQTIALIHDSLYTHESLDKVGLDVYIYDLLQHLKMAFEVNVCTVHFEVEVDSISIDLKNAVPLGLIINELFTNSMKYATTENDSLQVGLKLTIKEDGFFELVYWDNGPGFIINDKNKSSLGIQLINDLALQLNGEVIKDPVEGSKFIIIFKPIA